MFHVVKLHATRMSKRTYWVTECPWNSGQEECIWEHPALRLVYLSACPFRLNGCISTPHPSCYNSTAQQQRLMSQSLQLNRRFSTTQMKGSALCGQITAPCDKHRSQQGIRGPEIELGTVPVAFVVDKMATGTRLSPGTPLSVSFHQCSITLVNKI